MRSCCVGLFYPTDNWPFSPGPKWPFSPGANNRMGKHESITVFQKKYSKHVADQILLSQKDIGNAGMLKLYPVYMLPFILEEL